MPSIYHTWYYTTLLGQHRSGCQFLGTRNLVYLAGCKGSRGLRCSRFTHQVELVWCDRYRWTGDMMLWWHEWTNWQDKRGNSWLQSALKNIYAHVFFFGRLTSNWTTRLPVLILFLLQISCSRWLSYSTTGKLLQLVRNVIWVIYSFQ